MLTLDHGHFTRVVTLADEIMGEEKRKESGGRTVAFGEFLHLIGYIIRHAHIAGSSEKTSVYQISRLLAELDRNCAREWSLESMAAFVRMSQSSFRQPVPFDDGNGARSLICFACGFRRRLLCCAFPEGSAMWRCVSVFRIRTISRASSTPFTGAVRANTSVNIKTEL